MAGGGAKPTETLRRGIEEQSKRDIPHNYLQNDRCRWCNGVRTTHLQQIPLDKLCAKAPADVVQAKRNRDMLYRPTWML